MKNISGLGDVFETVVILLLALAPTIFVLYAWSRMISASRTEEKRRQTIRRLSVSEKVIKETVDLALHTCPNCGINKVSGKETWEVCERCRKDPAWWMLEART